MAEDLLDLYFPHAMFIDVRKSRFKVCVKTQLHIRLLYSAERAS